MVAAHQPFPARGAGLAERVQVSRVWIPEGRHTVAGMAQAPIDDGLTTMDPASASR